EHDPDNNNGWIEWDVPLEGEMNEPMVDPEVNEEVVDDDWNDEVEWLMAPMTPPRATMTVSGTYEVMGSQTGQIVSRLKEIETRVQQVESRVGTHPSGQMAVQGQDVIARS
nr:hypothetical protein [Tanacetum cinerariifolium]